MPQLSFRRAASSVRRPVGRSALACTEALPRVGPCAARGAARRRSLVVARCRECSGRRLAFAQARAAVLYDERARRLVRAWKERGVRLVAPHAAELVVEAVARPRVDALAALPADAERALRRGRHPAEQLAALLSRAWELPLDTSLARRTSLHRQRGLSGAERRRNVRDAFVVRGTPPATRRARRRRVHDRRHRRRGRAGASARRNAPGGGHHARSRGAPALTRCRARRGRLHPRDGSTPRAHEWERD